MCSDNRIRASDSVIWGFPQYPLNFISDIGGIAGLVLGINLVHIISTSIAYLKPLQNKPQKLSNKRDQVYIQRTQF